MASYFAEILQENMNKSQQNETITGEMAPTHQQQQHPADSWFNNLTNKEELLQRWSEKLKKEKYGNLRLYNYTDEITTLPPSDPSWAGIYHYGLIILYAVVLITIIVVAIKSCIVLFEKSDTSKLDGCKDSPSILRMPVPSSSSATTGATILSSRLVNNEILNTSTNLVGFDSHSHSHSRSVSVSPRSLILVQQTSTTSAPASVIPILRSTSPCCINNCCCCTCSSNTTGNTGNKRLLHCHARGVSLESEKIILNPCGSCCLHDPQLAIFGGGGGGANNACSATSCTATNVASSRYQRQYQYQHQHTNESTSLQWDSLNTNTDHSGESPPSYEIALGVEIASRPQSAGNCSDTENA